MDAIQRRTIVGVSGLVTLWVVVYWAWEPRSDRGPTVSFTEHAPAEASEPAPDPQPVEDSPPPEQAEPALGPVDEPESPFGEPPFRWYVARDGDTFERIAERELGSKALWTAIARANPLKDPERLDAGERIKIPRDPANPQARRETEPEVPPAPPVVEYTVQQGDTLSAIAQRFYGSVSFVEFLYDANRDRLRSKDDLRLGQVLVIPSAPGGPGG